MKLFRSSRRPLGQIRSRKPRLRLEVLEDRTLPSGFAQSLATPNYVIYQPAGPVTPFAAASPTGYIPSQIRHAYGFDQIVFPGGVPADGAGTTIAIVNAFDNPNIVNDLHQFDVRFNLTDPVFTKVDQRGGNQFPRADAGWAGEIALDVEWAHAIAPGASILLVETDDNSFTNLLAGVAFAASQPGVVVVSMSWGGTESAGETALDSTFRTPSGHGGVTFVAAAGDRGAPPSYPAISPNVLAVGGTTLNVDGQGTFVSESGWSGSGGGISTREAQPVYQNGVVTQTTSFRANPDVAYDANPATGVPVYDSYNNGSAAPWSKFGGTSAGAPQWAALLAIANQGRLLAGKGTLDGPSQTLPLLYELSPADFHDITSGTSLGTPQLAAGPGYDLVAGRGTPLADKVVADLVGNPVSTPTASQFRVSAPTGSPAGSAFSITVTALDQNNQIVPGYKGTVHFTSSDETAVLPADYTFTASDNGVHTFPSGVTLKKAGSQTVTVHDASATALTGSATVGVTAASPSRLAFAQQPTNIPAREPMTPAVTVQVLDQNNNLVADDQSDKVTLTLASNPGGATLSGTTIVTVQNGVATFGDLVIDVAGTGYTLRASSGSLTTATSASFNVTPATAATVLESFENGLRSYRVAGGSSAPAKVATAASHDGTFGLTVSATPGWLYRDTPDAQVEQGDILSTWVQFAGGATGRAYFGVGASRQGTLSVVLAANTRQLIIQDNSGYGYVALAAVPQGYLPNHWYRLEVAWGTDSSITGRLYDSDGTTLLNTVRTMTNRITAGGIAFRGIPGTKYFDTVTVLRAGSSLSLRLVRGAFTSPAPTVATTSLSPRTDSISQADDSPNGNTFSLPLTAVGLVLLSRTSPLASSPALAVPVTLRSPVSAVDAQVLPVPDPAARVTTVRQESGGGGEDSLPREPDADPCLKIPPAGAVGVPAPNAVEKDPDRTKVMPPAPKEQPTPDAAPARVDPAGQDRSKVPPRPAGVPSIPLEAKEKREAPVGALLLGLASFEHFGTRESRRLRSRRWASIPQARRSARPK